jgi:chromosome segregation ATPase
METALTEQDIELVTANINDVQVRIQEWKTRVDARKTEFDADMQKAKEEFDGTVARVSSDLGTLKARIESYTQKLAGYTVGLKELQSEYHGLINLYLGKTQQQGQVN